MPKDEEFSIELKMSFFRVTDFVEREREMAWLFLCTRQLHVWWRCFLLRLPQLVAPKRNLQNNDKNRKKNSKRLSIVLAPESNLLQFSVDIIGSGVGHLLRSQIPFLLFHFRYRRTKQEIWAVRHLRSEKWLRIRFDTTLTWFWPKSVIPRSSIYCRASTMSIPIFPSNRKPRFGATWND